MPPGSHRRAGYAGEVPSLERLDADALRTAMVTYRTAVYAHCERLNALNVYPVPDGDTGTNLARTLDAVVEALDGAAPDLDATCAAIAHGSLMGARGNSGVILSQILRALTTAVRTADTAAVTALQLAHGLGDAAVGAYRAVLTPVEGTILTVAREAAAAAAAAADAGAGLVTTIEAAQLAGERALDATPKLLPVLARAGVVDAGGAGFVLFLDALRQVIDGTAIADPEPLPAGVGVSAAPDLAERSAISGPRYEVMFFCDIADEHVESLKRRWGEIGDSIVVVGGDGLWNCHVHSSDIGAAIEAALDLGGRPRAIRVTDLFEQVDEHATATDDHHRAGGSPAVSGRTPGRLAVVAVASGPGLARLFLDAGADVVVEGGQTQNPSTAELLAAFERCGGAAIVVLPNNKNIIPVARQAAAVHGAEVAVVPTTTMPEGLSAIVAFDPDGDLDTTSAAMGDAASCVRTGEVTRAVRDTETEIGAVLAGQWIGLVRGEGVVAADDDLLEVSQGLLAHLLGEGGELVTVICGADAPGDVTAALGEWIESAEVQAEIHDGGQALYPYLFGVE